MGFQFWIPIILDVFPPIFMSYGVIKKWETRSYMFILGIGLPWYYVHYFAKGDIFSKSSSYSLALWIMINLISAIILLIKGWELCQDFDKKLESYVKTKKCEFKSRSKKLPGFIYVLIIYICFLSLVTGMIIYDIYIGNTGEVKACKKIIITFIYLFLTAKVISIYISNLLKDEKNRIDEHNDVDDIQKFDEISPYKKEINNMAIIRENVDRPAAISFLIFLVLFFYVWGLKRIGMIDIDPEHFGLGGLFLHVFFVTILFLTKSSEDVFGLNLRPLFKLI